MRSVILALSTLALFLSAQSVDLSQYIFVEFSPGEYFPYVVVNSSALEPAPVVYLMAPRDVILQELARNTTMYLPQGVYLAIPRKNFSKQPPTPPPWAKGRVADLEVEGLGAVRLLLARNATEVPGAVALYAYLDVEERGGRYYHNGKPLDVRKPRTPRGANGGTAAPGEIQPTYYTDTRSGASVSSWARYVFNPASPANVKNIPLTSYAPVTYFNATGYSNNDFVVGRTTWAYLGYGVSDVYVAVRGGAGGTIRFSLCPYDAPTSAPPSSPTSSPCVRNTITTFNVGRLQLARVGVPYSNKYLWFYAEVYNPFNNPVNASIAVVYQRPAPTDSSLYSLLTANWLSSVGQPGYTFRADYGSNFRVSRLLFTIKVPPGAQMPVNIALRGLNVFTCSSSPTLTVKIYSPADPSAYITATGQKITTAECGTYQFNDIYGTLPETAIAPLLAANSTQVPLIIEFSPALYASYPSRVYVTFTSLFAYGQRWPEIWRHNAKNWIDLSYSYAYIGSTTNIVFRDFLAFSVWTASYDPKNESKPAPWSDVYILGYGALTTQAGADIGRRSPTFPRISLQYYPFDQYLQLKRICLALENVKDWGVSSLSIYTNINGQNAWLEAFAAILSGVINVIGNAITAYQVISAIFGLTAPPVLGPLGYVVWGLGIFAQLAPTSGNYGCAPSANWISSGYDAGTGYITSADWYMSTSQPPQYTGGVRVKLSLLIDHGFVHSLKSVARGSGTYVDFFSYALFDSDAYFPSPIEPYALGVGRFYIKIVPPK